MKIICSSVSFLILLVNYSHQQSSANSTHYWAGVVEFSSVNVGNLNENIAYQNLFDYIKIIRSPEADLLDIIVFPESTLNSERFATYVPDPSEHIVPCRNAIYRRFVRDISCAAKERQKYIVINLTEKADCPEKNDTRPCTSNGLNKYNSNVVFDRKGAVISKYRKFNLFGEVGINTTVLPQTVTFDTDFGVKFGHFICFDLMFDVPAMNLVRSGITDIIFPSMWFSELPFLTAVQIQQNWAYSNNVNLLASGASFPQKGSTGTGIYAGKQGRLVSVMNIEAETKLYSAHVPKRNSKYLNADKNFETTPNEMSNLYLKRDQLDYYATKLLPLKATNINETLCYGNLLCCDFSISYHSDDKMTSYRYRLAVYNGMRTFDGFADGIIIVCGIIACTNENLASCGLRFPKNTDYGTATFNRIDIEGNFDAMPDQLFLPTGVDTSIMPLDVDEFEYTVGDKFTMQGKLVQNIKYRLMNPRSNLLSFAIYGRSFYMTAASVSNQPKNLLVVAVGLISFWYIRT